MSVISGVTGAIMGSEAADKAADAQVSSAKMSADVQKYMYNTSREDYAPWRETGANALEELSNKVRLGPGEFSKDPAYNFRLAEGQKAIERSAAARGNVSSPATSKALLRYSQDYASNEYDNFLAQYYQSLTPYQSLAQVGQTATAGTTNAGMNAANAMSQAALASGNAQAAGYINSANAVAGGLNSIGNNALAGYNAWRQYNSGNSNIGSGYNSTPAEYNYNNAGAMTDYGSGNYFQTVDPSLL